jgi:hypothetical protein
MMGRKHDSKQPSLEGVPAEEGVSAADAADRVDEAPDEQLNRPDQPGADPDEVRQYGKSPDRWSDADQSGDR